MLERFLFVLLAFRHETLEDALRLADQLFRDAQLGQTGAGKVIFVIAE